MPELIRLPGNIISPSGHDGLATARAALQRTMPRTAAGGAGGEPTCSPRHQLTLTACLSALSSAGGLVWRSGVWRPGVWRPERRCGGVGPNKQRSPSGSAAHSPPPPPVWPHLLAAAALTPSVAAPHHMAALLEQRFAAPPAAPWAAPTRAKTAAA